MLSIKNTLKVSGFALSAILLVACSKAQDKYVGYWKLDKDNSNEVLSIYKEGKETYLIKENILEKEGSRKNPKAGTQLEVSDKSLSFNTGMGTILFNLSEDGKTIRVSNQSYQKISDSDAEKLIENSKQCNQLRESYREESSKIDIFNRDASNALQQKYAQSQSKIPDCKIVSI